MFAAVDARVKAPFLIVETGQPVRSMRRYGGFPHWIRVAAGKSKDRFGQSMPIKLSGPVEAWFADAAAGDETAD